MTGKMSSQYQEGFPERDRHTHTRRDIVKTLKRRVEFDFITRRNVAASLPPCHISQGIPITKSLMHTVLYRGRKSILNGRA